GLWISGLRILFSENQGGLPRKAAMNLKRGTVFVVNDSSVGCGCEQSRDSNSQNCLFHSFQCLL
ncbi:hypothetical protein ACV1C5_12325, partial [Aeromonas caviae]